MNIISILLILISAGILYASCKHQVWLKKPLPTRPWRWVGWGLSLFALIYNIILTSVNNGIFAWIAFNVLCFGLMPFIVWYFKNKQTKNNQS